MAEDNLDNTEVDVKDIPDIVATLETVGRSLATPKNAKELTKLLNKLKAAVLGLTNLVKDNTEE